MPKPSSSAWRCTVCGYVHRGREAPELCPVCGAPQSAFEAFADQAAPAASQSPARRWRCLNCGYLHEGPEAPAACPACAHPQAYFELLGENW